MAKSRFDVKFCLRRCFKPKIFRLLNSEGFSVSPKVFTVGPVICPMQVTGIYSSAVAVFLMIDNLFVLWNVDRQFVVRRRKVRLA